MNRWCSQTKGTNTIVRAFFFFGPALFVPQMVQSGNFDMTFFRPLNSLVFNVFLFFREVFFGHVTLAIIMFCISINQLDISWTAWKILWFSLDILGATLIQSGILIIITAISFVAIKTNHILKI